MLLARHLHAGFLLAVTAALTARDPDAVLEARAVDGEMQNVARWGRNRPEERERLAMELEQVQRNEMPNAPPPSHAVQVLSSAARDERQVMLDVSEHDQVGKLATDGRADPMDAAMAKWQATVDARLDRDLDTYARQMLTVEQMVAGHLRGARRHQGTLSMARRSADLHQIHRLLKTLQQTAHELHHKKDALRRRESHKQRVQKLRSLFRRAKIVWNSLFDGMMSAEVRHQYETAFHMRHKKHRHNMHGHHYHHRQGHPIQDRSTAAAASGFQRDASALRSVSSQRPRGRRRRDDSTETRADQTPIVVAAVLAACALSVALAGLMGFGLPYKLRQMLGEQQNNAPNDDMPNLEERDRLVATPGAFGAGSASSLFGDAGDSSKGDNDKQIEL